MTFTLSYWLKSSFDGLSLMILYLWVCINSLPFEAKFSLKQPLVSVVLHLMSNQSAICFHCYSQRTLKPYALTANICNFFVMVNDFVPLGTSYPLP